LVSINPRYSCPTEGPGLFRVGTHEETATAMWSLVLGVESYQIEVQRREANGATYTTVALVGVDETEPAYRDFRLGTGIFRARIRVQSCGEVGSWSPWFEYSIGEGARVVVVGPVPRPPDAPGGASGGEGGSGAGPGGDGAPGGGGAGGGGSNPPPGSDDGKPPCRNGNSGDHNDDGHRDCGKDKD
jgi:hypothetical protein